MRESRVDACVRVCAHACACGHLCVCVCVCVWARARARCEIMPLSRIFCQTTNQYEPIHPGKPIHAHRAILSARSEHFANMFKSGLKVCFGLELAPVFGSALKIILAYIHPNFPNVATITAYSLTGH